jgi:hypothetical protein
MTQCDQVVIVDNQDARAVECHEASFFARA